MNEKDFNTSKKIIRETFNDKRKIKCAVCKDELQLDENLTPHGDLFLTENDEIIDLEFQIDDFTAENLANLVELAEILYEKYPNRISIYIICTDNVQVLVKECEIPSKADFTIKLTKFNANPAHEVLNSIKLKLKEEKYLSFEDLEILKKLPEICKKEERNYFLVEYFRIISKI